MVTVFSREISSFQMSKEFFPPCIRGWVTRKEHFILWKIFAENNPDHPDTIAKNKIETVTTWSGVPALPMFPRQGFRWEPSLTRDDGTTEVVVEFSSKDNDAVDELINYIVGRLESNEEDEAFNEFLRTEHESEIGKKLIHAVGNGLIDEVEDLLNQGVNIQFSDNQALMSAVIFCGRLDVIRKLLSLGADIHARDDGVLSCATGEGKIDLVKFFLDSGLNINQNSGQPLKMACWAPVNRLETVKLLLDRGADIDFLNGFYCPVRNDDLEMTILLMENGINYEGYRGFKSELKRILGTKNLPKSRKDLIEVLKDHVFNKNPVEVDLVRIGDIPGGTKSIKVHMFQIFNSRGGTVFVEAPSKEAAVLQVARDICYVDEFDEEEAGSLIEAIGSDEYAWELELIVPDDVELTGDVNLDLADDFEILAREDEGAEEGGFVPDTVTQVRLIHAGEAIPDGWTTPRFDDDAFSAIFLKVK